MLTLHTPHSSSRAARDVDSLEIRWEHKLNIHWIFNCSLTSITITSNWQASVGAIINQNLMLHELQIIWHQMPLQIEVCGDRHKCFLK